MDPLGSGCVFGRHIITGMPVRNLRINVFQLLNFIAAVFRVNRQAGSRQVLRQVSWTAK